MNIVTSVVKAIQAKEAGHVEAVCPVCGNIKSECVCCPECGHVCALDSGGVYCPVCGPAEPAGLRA